MFWNYGNGWWPCKPPKSKHFEHKKPMAYLDHGNRWKREKRYESFGKVYSLNGFSLTRDTLKIH